MNITHELLKKYIDDHIVYRSEYKNLTLYNYSQKCQYNNLWDDITIQCRGLILDADNNIIARPFDKFFNIEEYKHGEIPSSVPLVFKKYDGSLGILFWHNEEPFICTRGSFVSEQSQWATKWLRSNIPLHIFDRTKTYLFEIIYEKNRIIVSYPWEGLVLLAIRDIKSGNYEPISLLHEKLIIAEPFTFTDIKSLQMQELSNEEGFVLFYPHENIHIKVKFKEYVRLHALISGINKKSICSMLSSFNESAYNQLLEICPDELFEKAVLYKKELTEEYNTIYDEMIKISNKVKNFPTRKEQAIYLQSNYSYYLSLIFLYLDGRNYQDNIWKKVKDNINEHEE